MERNIIHFLSFSKNEIYLKMLTNDLQTHMHSHYNMFMGLLNFGLERNSTKINTTIQNKLGILLIYVFRPYFSS